jgi:hypothetical protein
VPVKKLKIFGDICLSIQNTNDNDTFIFNLINYFVCLLMIKTLREWSFFAGLPINGWVERV